MFTIVGNRRARWLSASAPKARVELVAVDQAAPVKLMVYSGEPLREPVAMGGPFVMNKRIEIA
jgi:redox-sensitive bicupin YhaK (pirin superfamily)